MKLNYRSIKFQITAAFLMLAVPLLLIAYYNLATHQAFISVFEKTSQREALLEATLGLQRDVIDLQRNVLIYKKNVTASSAQRVDSLYQSLTDGIAKLNQQPILKEFDKLGALAGIAHHLDEYKANFDVVVSYRQQKATIVQQHIDRGFDRLQEILDESNISELEKAEIIALLAYAHAQSMGYLISNNHSHVKQFQQKLKQLRVGLLNIIKDDANRKQFISELRSYERNLSRIVTLSRNYTYLVSVVMAGSAKEILYQSNYLVEQVRSSADIALLETTESMDQRKIFVFTVSAIGLLIAIIVPAYFSKLISEPIQQITGVFNDLATGKTVDQIPGQNRTNEIGLLANAAQVFKRKNEETHLLLEKSEHSFEVQQGLIKELVEAKSRIEKALSIKSDFLANMSHELRTPLNSVIGYTVRILKNPDNLNERQLSALTTVERNGRHLLCMINDILDLSKIEADKLDVNIQQVDLPQLCQDVIEQMSAAAEEKDIKLLLREEQDVDSIETDPVRLVQILINLLSNAIKFTDIGWVKLSIDLNKQSQTISVTVSDSGIGIKQEDLSRLFERFEQADQAQLQAIGHGTGLGLAIVEKLTNLLGGSITAESELGVGSRFCLSLPLRHGAENSNSLYSKSA